MNITRNFFETAARSPDATFLVAPDETAWSYQAVADAALRFAGFLGSRGVAPGDRVVLTFPNSVDYLVAYIGTLAHGAVATLVDHRSVPRHVDFVVRDCGARLWISPAERPDYAGIPGHVAFADHVPSPPADPRTLDVAQPLALIMYTSGTTGTPKGVRLLHANLQHTQAAIRTWAAVEPDERELTTLSLTHLFGLAHLHVHWSLGGAVIVDDSLRDVPRVLGRMKEHQATSFPGTPAGFKLILDRFAEQFRVAAASLRYIIINSAPMDPADVARLRDLIPHVRLYMYYGLTEASRSTAIHYNAHADKLATVGRPTPGSEVCIGAPNARLIGETGEILVRGPHVTPGYWSSDSSEYFVDGWFRTGDLGRVDAEGFVTWEGRVREQINVDGLKVSPLEVEAVLRMHPRVRDCAVIGAPDPLSGQTVVAYVVVDGEWDRSLETEVRRFCKPYLEFYKIPRKLTRVQQIPRTDTGKVKRLSLLDEPPA